MQPFKKNPKKQLEKFSTIFMQIGLVLVLFIVHVFIEYETEQDLAIIDMRYDPTEPDYLPDAILPVQKEKKVVKAEQPKQIEPKPKPKPLIDIKKVPDDRKTIETKLPTTDDELKKIDNLLDGMTSDGLDDDPPLENDVTFLTMEKVPTFPGCKGDNDELRACFNKKMQRHFAKKFDAELPNELGLSAGKKNVIMLFVINKEGVITDIKVKAPHPRLRKEAIRIVKKLPKMKPGMQRGTPVGVKYTLPMKVIVE
ncbi:energy transducer TonB [Flavobacteriaceae bacterium S356]|uniref:Energy transducer TonB n=1 Tax=Asprobacillus argus TaxID=3076534 RepID=A0ABU3LHS9_9FLAO|nr:energy transducer TonB [Flavobacteriaceae bacterium S356]